MQFQVMRSDDAGETWTKHCEVTYASFDAAKAGCERSLTWHPNAKFKAAAVEAVVDDRAWRVREIGRFIDGTYTDLPWRREPFSLGCGLGHYAHVSTANDGLVAYTPSPEFGAADRQLRVKPGRYLAQFYSADLSPQQIADWASALAAQNDADGLKITQDADEIEEVYLNGPDSCMSHAADDYQSPVHPVRVYAGPDLALAYLGPLEAPTARAVVWPENMLWSSNRHGNSAIYGNSGKLASLLKAAGYSCGSLRGARLRRIPCDNGFVMPYIDAQIGADDDGEFLILGAGCLTTDNQSGVTGDVNRAICERCENSYDGETWNGMVGGQCWCERCYDNCTIRCDECNETFDRYNSDLTQIVVRISRYGNDTNTLCEHCLSDAGVVEVGGTVYGNDLAFHCEDCEEGCLDSDRHDHGGRALCEDCHDTAVEAEEAEAPAEPAPSTEQAPELYEDAVANGQHALPLDNRCYSLIGKRGDEAEFKCFISDAGIANTLGTYEQAHNNLVILRSVHPSYTYTIREATSCYA